ncbi:MAG: hypothetical protein IIY21_25355 [Clostridiales bacterium]|nr:hypothetical protein [Clostridiales bacterium]
MAEVYTPISRQEVLKALVNKFGAVETARYFLSDALSDLSSMEVGVGDNNPLLAMKNCESLKENLTNLRTLFENKDYKPSIEKAVKNNLQ